jgi:hypothetical protein
LSAKRQLIKPKKEIEMSGIATILGWAGFITLVSMMLIYLSKKWLRKSTDQQSETFLQNKRL